MVSDRFFNIVIYILIIVIIKLLIFSLGNISKKDQIAQKEQIIPYLIETAKRLSDLANKQFHEKKYTEALQTYDNALSTFHKARKGAKAINDTALVETLSKNIDEVHTNMKSCKNTIDAQTEAKN